MSSGSDPAVWCASCGGRRRIVHQLSQDESQEKLCDSCGPNLFLFNRIRTELRNARVEHPQPFNSAHEGYAVLLEEVEELWLEVMKKKADRDLGKMRNECIQIAAMAIKFLEDLT